MKYFSISANYSLQILVVNPQIRIFPSWQNFWPPPFFLYSKTFKKSSSQKSQLLSQWLQTYWVIFDLMKSGLDYNLREKVIHLISDMRCKGLRQPFFADFLTISDSFKLCSVDYSILYSKGAFYVFTLKWSVAVWISHRTILPLWHRAWFPFPSICVECRCFVFAALDLGCVQQLSHKYPQVAGKLHTCHTFVVVFLATM